MARPLNNIHHLADRINKKDRIGIFNADLNDLSSIYKMINEIKLISYFISILNLFQNFFDIPIETLTTNIIGTANLLESIKQKT